MTEFLHSDDEELAEELAIDEAFPVPALTKRVSTAEYLRRREETDKYWFGGPMPRLPHPGDDMFEHM